jgi:hypothetical protein
MRPGLGAYDHKRALEGQQRQGKRQGRQGRQGKDMGKDMGTGEDMGKGKDRRGGRADVAAVSDNDFRGRKENRNGAENGKSLVLSAENIESGQQQAGRGSAHGHGHGHGHHEFGKRGLEMVKRLKRSLVGRGGGSPDKQDSGAHRPGSGAHGVGKEGTGHDQSHGHGHGGGIGQRNRDGSGESYLADLESLALEEKDNRKGKGKKKGRLSFF